MANEKTGLLTKMDSVADQNALRVARSLAARSLFGDKNVDTQISDLERRAGELHDGSAAKILSVYRALLEDSKLKTN